MEENIIKESVSKFFFFAQKLNKFSYSSLHYRVLFQGRLH